MGRLKVIVAGCIVLLLLGTMGFFLTKDSIFADHTTEETMLVLKTNKKISKDTLEKNKIIKMNELIKEYYDQKATEEKFSNEYQNITVYSMPAKTIGDFIVYATYEVKIKDIVTLVPGLETFYVKKTGEDTYQLADISASSIIQNEIKDNSEKDVVQELIQSVDEAYAEVKSSNSTLASALEDLQNTYE